MQSIIVLCLFHHFCLEHREAHIVLVCSIILPRTPKSAHRVPSFLPRTPRSAHRVGVFYHFASNTEKRTSCLIVFASNAEKRTSCWCAIIFVLKLALLLQSDMAIWHVYVCFSMCMYIIPSYRKNDVRLRINPNTRETR